VKPKEERSSTTKGKRGEKFLLRRKREGGPRSYSRPQLKPLAEEKRGKGRRKDSTAKFRRPASPIVRAEKRRSLLLGKKRGGGFGARRQVEEGSSLFAKEKGEKDRL